MSKKEYTYEELQDAFKKGQESGRKQGYFDKTLFILELIAALNTTGGDSISREALEKMVQS